VQIGRSSLMCRSNVLFPSSMRKHSLVHVFARFMFSVLKMKVPSKRRRTSTVLHGITFQQVAHVTVAATSSLNPSNQNYVHEEIRKNQNFGEFLLLFGPESCPINVKLRHTKVLFCMGVKLGLS
jgi:hypothetical protein